MLGSEERCLLSEAKDFLDTCESTIDLMSVDEDEAGEEDGDLADDSFEGTMRLAECYDSENLRTVELTDCLGVELIGSGVVSYEGAVISFIDSVTGELSLAIDVGRDEMQRIIGEDFEDYLVVTGQQEYIDMFAQGLRVLRNNLQ